MVFWASNLYAEKRSAWYLAADAKGQSGSCQPVPTGVLSGTYALDANGRWENDPDYVAHRTLFSVEFKQLPTERFADAMRDIAVELRKDLVDTHAAEPRTARKSITDCPRCSRGVDATRTGRRRRPPK